MRAGYAEVAKYGCSGMRASSSGARRMGRHLLGGPERGRGGGRLLPRQGRRRDTATSGRTASAPAQFSAYLRPRPGAADGYDAARLLHGEGVAIGLALAFRFFGPARPLPRPGCGARGQPPRVAGLPDPPANRCPAGPATRMPSSTHGSGQEGPRRADHLHPRPRHRPELHRAGQSMRPRWRAFLEAGTAGLSEPTRRKDHGCKGGPERAQSRSRPNTTI